jgi:hypothetical protein
MVRPEFFKIENITKTGKGKNIFSKAKRKFLDQNSSVLKIENETNQKRGKTFFLKSETKFFDQNSPRSKM